MSSSRSALVLAVLAALAAVISHQVVKASPAPEPAPFNLGQVLSNAVHTGKNIVECVKRNNIPASMAIKVASCSRNKNSYVFAGCAGIKNIDEATKLFNCIAHS